jgi:FKBP-type peptidyl-prolyl cis-trans isomerase FklB
MMNSKTLLVAPFLGLLCGVCSAAEPAKLETENEKINYSVGYQLGGDFKRQGITMDAESVVKGIEDALSGAEPLMDSKARNATLMELKRTVDGEQRTRQSKGELEYLAEGKKYMQENASKPGVSTSKSGLQYRIIEAGTGKAPTPTDQVTVNYRGTLIDGSEFDSSYKRGKPATFGLNKVIKGWTEGLQLVKPGGKIQLVIPPELAYDRGPMAHRTLLFDVELISVETGKQAKSTPTEKAKE